MLRHEASVSSVADASYLSMTVNSGLLQAKRISTAVGFKNDRKCKKQRLQGSNFKLTHTDTKNIHLIFKYLYQKTKFINIYIVILCILLYIYIMNEDFINKWISQVKKGTLSFIVLNVLKSGKAYYGYDLINEIKKITEIEIAEGTLYPLMNRLKDEKLIISEWVEQESGIPRKYYSITPEGKNTVTKMGEYWHNLNNSVLKITK